MIAVYSLWRGPSCITHIHTAVQTDQLAAWNRVRTARKGLAALRARIELAQGTVPPEELRTQLMTLAGGQTADSTTATG